MEEIIGYTIKEILSLEIEGVLISLHFNLTNSKNKRGVILGIGEDGESITINSVEGWVNPIDISDERNQIKVFRNKGNISLDRLIDSGISDISLGIGTDLIFDLPALYYFLLRTQNQSFLFFNNGDVGTFSFDEIDEILANDIYNFEWKKRIPGVE